MVRLPLFSVMHVLKFLMSPAHTPVGCVACACWCCCAKSVFWGEASAGAELPPLKKPPMAWPMEDPTATPLLSR